MLPASWRRRSFRIGKQRYRRARSSRAAARRGPSDVARPSADSPRPSSAEQLPPFRHLDEPAGEDLLRRQRPDVCAVEPKRAARAESTRGDGAQQRRLAGAVAADEGDDLAGCDLEARPRTAPARRRSRPCRSAILSSGSLMRASSRDRPRSRADLRNTARRRPRRSSRRGAAPARDRTGCGSPASHARSPGSPTPWSRIFLMTSITSSTSTALRPAITSSSSSSFGRIASALASSSRLRSGPPSSSARWSDAPVETREFEPFARALRAPARDERLAAAAAEQRADRDVLQHRQAGKRLHHLEGAADAEMRAPVRRQPIDARALEPAPRPRRAQACR